jgi:hypothetical protein
MAGDHYNWPHSLAQSMKQTANWLCYNGKDLSGERIKTPVFPDS